MSKTFAEGQKGGLSMNIFVYMCVSIVMSAIIFVFGVLLYALLNSCDKDRDTDTASFTVICLLSLSNGCLIAYLSHLNGLFQEVK